MGYGQKPASADAAQKQGWFSATAAAKLLKCKTKAIQEVLKPCSYYATGLRGAHTPFYDVRDLLDLASGNVSTWSKERLESVTALMGQIKSYKVAKIVSLFYKANVRYLEWFGTPDYPIASPRVIMEAMIEQRGKKLTIFAKGKTLVKMLGSKGVRIDKFPFSEMTETEFAEWKKANGYP